ncbi:hypothetical protein HQQ80_21125 [Microbacteriaceae bacterium VKM Ac-2855]|nr:hypothetical protein [Microbacteriaceae bacterium VKM Ac-2855]
MDDLALRSLIDVARILDADDSSCIVGGQMVSILTTAFPVAGVEIRRTADTDAGIAPAIAASGRIHEQLSSAGYKEESGNRYTKGVDPDRMVVDLLVPSPSGEFAAAEYGGRAFDAVPGLHLALHGHALTVDVGVTQLDGDHQRLEVRVPGVEAAVVLKALSYSSRRASKDVEDLYSLLHIANAYGSEEIGGWSLRAEPLSGSRKDASRSLHALARALRMGVVIGADQIPAEVFGALLERLVARTD